MTNSDPNDSLPDDSLIEQSRETAEQIRAEINKILIGQETVIEEVLIGLFAAGHILLEGVPGLGKTLLVRALAKTFDGEFSRIQFTPDLMPSDVTGHVIYDLKTDKFTTRKGPIFTNLLLADEINRAPAKTQSALLEVMQEQQVTMEGQSMLVPQPYMVLATQNPIEQEGTYPLPEAQLDRFLLKILIEYPTTTEEATLVKSVTNSNIGDKLDVSSLNAVTNTDAIQLAQKATASLTVDDVVNEYAVRIVRATRNWPGISIGAGPRGAIALIRCAKAIALLNNRNYVTPDDIKYVVLPALRHRILLSPELELEGQTNDQILTTLLNKIEAPRT